MLGVVGHVHRAIFFRRDELDGERLDDRHERHIRVGRHRDWPDIIGMEHLRDQNGGRAVRRADDADGGRVLEVKAQHDRRDHRKEDAELRRRAEEEHLRIGEQRAEVDHRADADEQQQRQRLARLDRRFEEPLDDALALAHARDHLVQNAGHRQVDEDRAEAHRQQQRGLIVLFDGKIDEQRAHHIHYALLPRHGPNAVEQKLHAVNTPYIQSVLVAGQKKKDLYRGRCPG